MFLFTIEVSISGGCHSCRVDNALGIIFSLFWYATSNSVGQECYSIGANISISSYRYLSTTFTNNSVFKSYQLAMINATITSLVGIHIHHSFMYNRMLTKWPHIY